MADAFSNAIFGLFNPNFAEMANRIAFANRTQAPRYWIGQMPGETYQGYQDPREHAITPPPIPQWRQDQIMGGAPFIGGTLGLRGDREMWRQFPETKPGMLGQALSYAGPALDALDITGTGALLKAPAAVAKSVPSATAFKQRGVIGSAVKGMSDLDDLVLDIAKRPPTPKTRELLRSEAEKLLGERRVFDSVVHPITGETLFDFRPQLNLTKGTQEALTRKGITDPMYKHLLQTDANVDTKFSKIWDDPVLFEQFPNLKDTVLKMLPETEIKRGVLGGFDPFMGDNSGKILLPSFARGDNLYGPLFHEMTHGVALGRGTAGGMNPDWLEMMAHLYGSTPKTMYNRNVGEQMADAAKATGLMSIEDLIKAPLARRFPLDMTEHLPASAYFDYLPENVNEMFRAIHRNAK